MENKGFSIEDILALADKVAEKQLGGIEVEQSGCRIKIDGKKQKQVFNTGAVSAAPAAAMEVPAAPVESAAPAAPAQVSGVQVKSPIVGTFYSCPAPEKPPFVKAGQAVKKGDVLFIIESMKLMNEVLSEQDGVVKEILAQDGQAVEYGEPVLVLE